MQRMTGKVAQLAAEKKQKYDEEQRSLREQEETQLREREEDLQLRQEEERLDRVRAEREAQRKREKELDAHDESRRLRDGEISRLEGIGAAVVRLDIVGPTIGDHLGDLLDTSAERMGELSKLPVLVAFLFKNIFSELNSSSLKLFGTDWWFT